MLDVVASYLNSLRSRSEAADPAAATLFNQIGCARCHVPELMTRDGRPIPAFTDLLLHDMGAALDDGVGCGTGGWRRHAFILRCGVGRRRGTGTHSGGLQEQQDGRDPAVTGVLKLSDTVRYRPRRAAMNSIDMSTPQPMATSRSGGVPTPIR